MEDSCANDFDPLHCGREGWESVVAMDIGMGVDVAGVVIVVHSVVDVHVLKIGDGRPGKGNGIGNDKHIGSILACKQFIYKTI